jgi:hypothetical protein
MNILKIHLLSNNTIFIGEVTKKANLLHTFYIKFDAKEREKLDAFFLVTKLSHEYFYKAFSYWVLCGLQRCQENKNRYGVLTRKLINFSKKLWKKIRSFARRIAKEIQLFQQRIRTPIY